MTHDECIDYLRHWGEYDCWNPEMKEVVKVVCMLAENSLLTKTEADKLEWLLDKSFGRHVQFLERFLLRGRTHVSLEAFARLINQRRL